MIASPLGKGLFRRAISESGPLFKTNVCPHLKEAEEEGLHTMKEKNAASLSAMRTMTAEELLKNDHRREPVIDGYVLPDELIHIFSAGKQNAVDLLIGYNEGDNAMETGPKTASAFMADIQKTFGPRSSEFLKIYPATNDGEAATSQIAISRDLIFAYESYTWAKWQISHGTCKAWFYYFSHGAPGKPWYGAFHGSQSAYSLHNLKQWNRPFVEWDRALSNSMSDYWINFAATGDPNGKGLPKWPAFMIKETLVIHFGDEITTTELPAMKAFDLFANAGWL
jgi:para-nitrobenzyl esterase